MAHVQVTIAGRAYRMACGDGEERHLEGLAASFDARIQEMRVTFGEIGDMRLHVMAALTAAAAADRERADKAEQHMAATLTDAAERVELLTRSLGPMPPAT